MKSKFPNNYTLGTGYYNTALVAHNGAQWDEVIDAAIRAIEILSVFEIVKQGQTAGSSGLVGQYTVRTWAVERDCLWNIAGYPWIYGDPRRWVELYEANKSKLPDPNNPHWIEPGMVLDIPNIKDDKRQGM
jgi:nucleoid-associated protein YgaU